jgi:UDP-3-O-[3-hydroxymyristoyl] N-acetylglucosamine deacetylase
MNLFRRLLHPVSFTGKGLHTGVLSEVTLFPLPPASRPELEIGGELVPLEHCRIRGAGRGTCVSFPSGSKSVKTTEHLFAALAALGIWSVRITVAGPEIPALDGAAFLFASSLLEASEPEENSHTFSPLNRAFSPAVPVTIVDEGKKSVIAVFPARSLAVTYVIQYAERPVGTQMAEFDVSRDDFSASIAEARTFALASEVEGLLAKGLARGGSLDNAVVVGENDVTASGGLRFPDEFVRHKILDLLGDLYLLGVPLNAHITALRAGHTTHCRLVERLRRLRRAEMFQESRLLSRKGD